MTPTAHLVWTSTGSSRSKETEIPLTWGVDGLRARRKKPDARILIGGRILVPARVTRDVFAQAILT